MGVFDATQLFSFNDDEGLGGGEAMLEGACMVASSWGS